MRVVIAGAGVIGLSAALHLLERFASGLDLTVVSDQFTPHITSDKACAIILPPNDVLVPVSSTARKCERNATCTERAQRWAKATLQRFHSLYMSRENAQIEICLEQGHVLFDSPVPDPWYKDEVFGFRHVELNSVEASLLHVPPECAAVWAFGTYVVETSSYLRWLMDQVRRRGAKFEQRKISSFDELSSYDIIINCTGLGSRELLDDKLMHPVRGQTVLVKAPWLKQWFHYCSSDNFCHIFPRGRDVVLGGTSEAGNWSETPDPKTAKDILKKCQKYFPSLSGAEVVRSWAGLRPLRDPIRLESCQGPAGSLLVHCYGHGGQGVVLSWGCAVDIGDIVQHSVWPTSSL